MKNDESSEQITLVAQLAMMYPWLKVFASLNGVKLTIGQAKKAKRMGMNRGDADLRIVHKVGDFHNLYIEYKHSSVALYQQNGEMYSKEHEKEQAGVLTHFQEQGDAATFAVGISNAIYAVQDYIQGKFINPDVYHPCQYTQVKKLKISK